MIGRTYLERGQPVVVLKRWGDVRPSLWDVLARIDRSMSPGAPRKVLIERQDGSRVVRPFRGLRKIAPASELDIAGAA